jgi:general secretion pathway protein E
MGVSIEGIAQQLDALPVNDDWGVAATALLLQAARDAGASDLHVLCQSSGVAIRMRCDAELFEVLRFPLARRDLLLARFKVMAKLPAFVRHEPQDGRLEWTPQGDSRPLQLRVAFLPTIHGESLNIRFPETNRVPMSINALGLRGDMQQRIESMLTASEGAFLVTGPSGSGKTTTLYALTRWLHEQRGDRVHVVSIEDPVECDLGFASQVQVDEAKGLTFAKGLRASLRQDPNAILIGEIRDLETGRIAMQAGMTGHLVLSSMHAGRAARVPSRLVSMGIDPFAVASALTGALAQRLVRTADGAGRRAVFELGIMTEAARDLVLARASTDVLGAEMLRICPGTLSSEADRMLAAGELESVDTRRIHELEEVES